MGMALPKYQLIITALKEKVLTEISFCETREKLDRILQIFHPHTVYYSFKKIMDIIIRKETKGFLSMFVKV